MADIKLRAQNREAVGKNKVNKLRQVALIPGVVYAKDEENVNVQFTARDFEKVLIKAGTSTIIVLDIDGNEIPVLIKSYQTHPFKSEFLHVDFQKIRAGESIKVNIPIALLGRDDIKVQPSVLIQNLDNIDVECLPNFIPQAAEISVENMQVGDSFTVSDLDVYKDENINVLTDADDLICSLQEPQEEVEIDEDAEVATEPELISDKADDSEEE